MPSDSKQTPELPPIDPDGWPIGTSNYDYRGLTHWHVSVYAQEVAHQAAQVIRGYRLLNEARARDDPLEAFFYVQAILTAAAIISQILWSSPGARRKARDRAATLRAAFGVSDESPLRPRSLRGHFAHFDERLDDWVKERPGHYTDLNMTDSRVINPRGALRHLDPTTLKVTYHGDGIALPELERAVRDLAKSIRDGGWQLHRSAFELAGEVEEAG